MRSQGISQFYLHTARTSANGMNHTCLPSEWMHVLWRQQVTIYWIFCTADFIVFCRINRKFSKCRHRIPVIFWHKTVVSLYYDSYSSVLCVVQAVGVWVAYRYRNQKNPSADPHQFIWSVLSHRFQYFHLQLFLRIFQFHFELQVVFFLFLLCLQLFLINLQLTANYYF